MSCCNICAEKHNKSTKKPIKCQYCTFKACRKCIETYILNSVEPHCMNPDCKKVWSYDFLFANFTKTWINGALASHRTDLLIVKEKKLR